MSAVMVWVVLSLNSMRQFSSWLARLSLMAPLGVLFQP